MKHDETLETVEAESHSATYEPPRIEDYGTLAQLTAGEKEGDDWDIISFEYGQGGGGGYS